MGNVVLNPSVLPRGTLGRGFWAASARVRLYPRLLPRLLWTSGERFGSLGVGSESEGCAPGVRVRGDQLRGVHLCLGMEAENLWLPPTNAGVCARAGPQPREGR